MKIFYSNTYITHRDKEKKLLDIFLQIKKSVENQPGCVAYNPTFTDVNYGEDNEVLVTEVWDTKQQRNEALKQSKISKLLKETESFIAKRPQKPNIYEINWPE